MGLARWSYLKCSAGYVCLGAYIYALGKGCRARASPLANAAASSRRVVLRRRLELSARRAASGASDGFSGGAGMALRFELRSKTSWAWRLNGCNRVLALRLRRLAPLCSAEETEQPEASLAEHARRYSACPSFGAEGRVAGRRWWIRVGLNHRPRDYESPALTAELLIHGQKRGLLCLILRTFSSPKVRAGRGGRACLCGRAGA